MDSDTPNDPKIIAITTRGVPNPNAKQAAAGALFLLFCYVADHGHPVEHGLAMKGDGTAAPVREIATVCGFTSLGDFVTFADGLADERLIHADLWRARQTILLPAMWTRVTKYLRQKGKSVSTFGSPNDLAAAIIAGTFSVPSAAPSGGKKGPRGGHRAAHTGQNTTPQDTTKDLSDDRPTPLDLLLNIGGDDQVDGLVKLWNQTRVPGPKVGEITDTRRRQFQRALKARPNLDDWRRAVVWINGQPWCNASGRGDHPTWRAALDWVAKPGQLAKLLDRIAADQPTANPSGVIGRNAAKGRTGAKRGEFAAALEGAHDHDPVH